MKNAVLHHHEGLPDAAGTVKIPADIHEHKCAKDLKDIKPSGVLPDSQPFPCVSVVLRQQSRDADDQAVVETVDDIVPGGPVPDTDDQEHDHIGDADRHGASGAFAQVLFAPFSESAHPAGKRNRIKKIILHPCPERDVPAVPEIRDRDGKIRLPEIFIERDPEHLRDAQDDIDPSGEIPVELGAVHEDAQDAVAPQSRVIIENRVDIKRRVVSDDDLLEKSPGDPVQPAQDPLHVEFFFRIERIGQPAVAPDRSLQDLRKEGEKKREAERIPLGLHSLPVHVKEIGCRLKSVK